MFPYSTELIVFEQHNARQERANKQRLLRAVEAQTPKKESVARKLANWTGTQLVRSGLRMQSQAGRDGGTPGEMVSADMIS